MSSLIPTGCGRAALGHRSTYFSDEMIERLAKCDLTREDLFFAWEISQYASGISENEKKAVIFIALSLIMAQKEGSTRIDLENGSLPDKVISSLSITQDEAETINSLLSTLTIIPGDENNIPLSALFGQPGSFRPLISGENFISIQRLDNLERRVGNRIKIMIEEPGFFNKDNEQEIAGDFKKALEDVLEFPHEGPTGTITLNNEQRNALFKMLSGKITLISGRPGSGKTSIIATLVRILARAGFFHSHSLAMAAPTGKAAERLKKSLLGQLTRITDPQDEERQLLTSPPRALTIHRLLGYSPARDKFLHNERNPMPEDLVIIDESSMLDLALFDHLLRALKPDAALILLGDAEQLPPVEAGAVFKDICLAPKTAGSGRIALLEESYRARSNDPQGAEILAAAEAINSGDMNALTGLLEEKIETANSGGLQFKGFEFVELDEPAQLNGYLERWLEIYLHKFPGLIQTLSREFKIEENNFSEYPLHEVEGIFALYENLRILCVTKISAGGTGSDSINQWFRNKWAEILNERYIQGNLMDYLIGEPVMINHNDYAHNLYNGDTGLILKTSLKDGQKFAPQVMAVFPGNRGFRFFPPEMLAEKIERAWATTVHKAQGSEFDHLTLILPQTHLRPLSRELLYTAVTRARKSSLIIGRKDVFFSGINSKVERQSGLPSIIV